MQLQASHQSFVQNYEKNHGFHNNSQFNRYLTLTGKLLNMVKHYTYIIDIAVCLRKWYTQKKYQYKLNRNNEAEHQRNVNFQG